MVDHSHGPLADAARHIDAEFGALRIERGVQALERRLSRRRAAQRGLVVGGSCALCALALFLWRADLTPVAAPDAYAASIQTSDGSRADSLSADSELRVERDAPEEVSLQLVRGKRHFDVTPNKRRRYRVRAGEVEVEVLGTAFVVERRRERAHVRVEHGVVKVSWRGGSTLLRVGDQGLFPPRAAPMPQAEAEPVPHASLVEPEAPIAQQETREEARATTSDRERWRALARAGKHQEAFGSLGEKPVDDLSGLLLAADAARLSGHPREAAQHLQRLIERYPRSASAHLSAFTLGRLALYELEQPRLAAESFARAYALNPRGPLAEDALAREAEAYHRAGDGERAKRAVERYLARYPKGARRAELLRYVESAAAAGK